MRNAEVWSTQQSLIQWDLYYRKQKAVRKKRLECAWKLNPRTGEEGNKVH